MKLIQLFWVVGAVFLSTLVACGQENKTHASATPAAPVSKSQSRSCDISDSFCLAERAKKDEEVYQIEQDKKIAAVVLSAPKLNQHAPESDYREVKTDYDSGLLRQAFGVKMSNGDLSSKIDSVRFERDQFKRADIEKAALLEFSSKVASIGSNRYIVMKNFPVRLEKYDMAKKQFSFNNFGQNTAFTLSRAGTVFDTKLKLTNAAQVSWRIEDELIARRIETSRASSDLKLFADLYGYAAGSLREEPDELITVITKVVIKDEKGVIQTVITPSSS